MNNFKKSFRELKEKIDSAKSVIVIDHKAPDGDVIASQLCLCNILKFYKPELKIVAYSEEVIPERFKFLEQIWPDRIIADKKIKCQNFDITIALDGSTEDRINIKNESFKKDCFLINIDHHVSNDFYADLTCIDDDASSTAEVIYQFAKFLNVKIDSLTANGIFAGIVSDLNFFKNYFNSETLRVAAELVDIGADPIFVSNNLIRTRSILSVLLGGQLCSESQFTESKNIGWIEVSYKTIKKYNAFNEYLQENVNMLNLIDNLKIAFIMVEKEPQKIFVEFRTKHHDIDVSKIVTIFDGGGHRMASGCVLNGTLEESRILILKKIKEIYNIE